MTRLLALAFVTFIVAGCGSMNVVSDGADSRLMLKGYDPVAYFTDGKPIVGKPEIKAAYEGVTYRFASEDHRRLFVANPSKFTPQFGGWCSNGMAYAIPLGGEPQNFKIIDGKLYLFGGNRSKLYFEMDQEKNLELARNYWETEVKDSNWRIQSWKRVYISRVPHYKTNKELAAEYEKRFGKPPE